jgi:hypothetical protein
VRTVRAVQNSLPIRVRGADRAVFQIECSGQPGQYSNLVPSAYRQCSNLVQSA